MTKTSPLLLLGVGVGALVLLGGGNSANGATGIVSLIDGPPKGPPPDLSGGPAPAVTVPPDPTIGASTSPVYASGSWVPSDVTTPAAIVGNQKNTVRQIQAALNYLGASPVLAVNGAWDVPTQQAVWDWQFLHEHDNPSSPLNVTGEVDQLTQNSIHAAVAAKAGIAVFY